MGVSETHTFSIPMVLNPVTGAITNPFHVVFDDCFVTVAASVKDLPSFQSNE
jgi:hypothetical protein